MPTCHAVVFLCWGVYFIFRSHFPRLNRQLSNIIIHQTHYEKSDSSRAFNQFNIACELDMINTISAADIAFIMSSSTSASWLLSPLECSPQKQNKARFIRRISAVSNAIQTKDNEANHLIIYCLNCIRHGRNATYEPGLTERFACVICLSLRLRQKTQTSVLIIHDIMLNLIQ